MNYGNAQPAKSKRLASGTPSWPKNGMQFNIDNLTLLRKGRLTEKKISLKLSAISREPAVKRYICLIDLMGLIRSIGTV